MLVRYSYYLHLGLRSEESSECGLGLYTMSRRVSRSCARLVCRALYQHTRQLSYSIATQDLKHVRIFERHDVIPWRDSKKTPWGHDIMMSKSQRTGSIFKCTTQHIIWPCMPLAHIKPSLCLHTAGMQLITVSGADLSFNWSLRTCLGLTHTHTHTHSLNCTKCFPLQFDCDTQMLPLQFDCYTNLPSVREIFSTLSL